jgi:protease PrsW
VSALMQTTVGSPSRACLARFAWLGVLLVGIALFEGVRLALMATANIHYAPALILLGAATIPFAFVTFVSARGGTTPVSATVLTATGLVGGVVGIVTAGLVEYDTLQRLGALPVVAIATIEELAKMVVPAMLLVPSWRRDVGSGLALGVAAGAGFAILETMGYAVATLVRSSDNLAAIDATLIRRGLLSPAAHMAWTGLTVAALAGAVAARWTRRAAATFVAAFAVAVALHSCWDGIGTITAYAALAAIGLTFLLAVARHLMLTPVEP